MALTMTLVSLASAAACCSESLTSRLAGTSGWTARTSSADEVPSLAAIEMPSKRPCLSSSVWAVGQVPDRDRGAAERVDARRRWRCRSPRSGAWLRALPR